MEAMYHGAVVQRAAGRLGVASGVGLVAANMIGAGVFVSAGYMAQEMGPGTILLAWAVGALVALSGARAYAELARIVPRSGGEYRYLSELLHPALGYLAGWASLLVGFAAPVAAVGLSAGGFAQTLAPALDPRWTGAALVVALTALHVAGIDVSVRTQNGLVLLKAILLAGFVWVGLHHGATAWPTWRPPIDGGGFPLLPFVRGLFYVAFAFSGWNAAAYVAEEFREPARTVPRAMMIGTILVGLLYLVVNWIFVANLTPEQAAGATGWERDRVTLGHAVVLSLRGPGAARAMSAVTVVIFVSTMSAMILVGPRVFQAMARDGYLPRLFAGEPGRPPVASALLQGALSLLFVFRQPLGDLIAKAGAVLTLFSALAVVGLLRARALGRREEASSRPPGPGAPPRPTLGGSLAGLLYVTLCAGMLGFALRGAVDVLPWLAVISAFGLAAWALTRRARRTEDVSR